MKISNTVLVKAAYDSLKNKIATKQLKGGDKIIEESLCNELAITTKTLRKAVTRLQYENLVVEVTGVGLVVRNFNYTDVIAMFDCRIAIEIMAIKQFVLNAPQQKIDDLRNLLVPFERGPQCAKVFQKINYHFHDIILANCGNCMAPELFEKGNIWLIMEIIGLKRPLNIILKEHLNLVSAIHQRDVDRAVHLMTVHLEHSKASFIS